MLVTIARNYEIKRARHTIVVKLQLAMGEFVVEPLAVPKGIIGDPPPPPPPKFLNHLHYRQPETPDSKSSKAASPAVSLSRHGEEGPVATHH